MVERFDSVDSPADRHTRSPSALATPSAFLAEWPWVTKVAAARGRAKRHACLIPVTCAEVVALTSLPALTEDATRGRCPSSTFVDAVEVSLCDALGFFALDSTHLSSDARSLVPRHTLPPIAADEHGTRRAASILYTPAP